MCNTQDPPDTARPVRRERSTGRASRHGTRWGNKVGPKDANTLRLGFLNPDGLPLDLRAEKYNELLDYVKDYSLDELGLTEINLNLKHLPSSNQWSERVRKFPANSNIAATNEYANFNDPKNLAGGVAMFSFNTMKARTLDKGVDTSGLGRWVWTRYKGRNNLIFRVVTGYRPVADGGDGTYTVFSQQEAVLKCKNDDRTPREAFLEDLKTELIEWNEQNELILLYLDINENLRSRKIRDYMESVGLVDVHQRHHPDLPMTETCIKNLSSYPIDGIWCSPAIEVTACGYAGYGEEVTNSDHRSLWVDITKASVFNYIPRDTKYQQPQRVNLQNENSIRRYGTLAERELLRHNRH